MAMTSGRFPPPWRVIEHEESFWVQDATGQTVGWFYFRNGPLVAKTAGVLLKDKDLLDGSELREAAGDAGEARRAFVEQMASSQF
jgi:hypothetical protein